MSKIGFIGLGIMGMPMSKNLKKAGFDLLAGVRNPARIKEAADSGIAVAESFAQVAQKCDIIVTMLPNSPQVKDLLLGENGIAKEARPGTLFVDMTSGAPGDSREIYAELKKMDLHFIDAPVSGGEPMAVAGTLAIMVGGDEADFERAKPLFAAMGNSATWVGPIGSGNTCKLTNQVIVAANIAALAEGLMLAEKAGANPQKVFEAIKGGLAGSNVMNAKAPMMLADNYKPGFRIDLHIKDLKNALDTGTLVDAPLPLAQEMLKIMERLSANGSGSCDHSAIAKYYEELGGVKFSD
ncbi:2-hydroxy-3-oxopropionate reductase [Dysosmobacter sp.]|uniref:2-hydroxy-3-oxopropionate reductase n=1 Tax=Dysosmobacter sp. TaxID=2591382 RepID=UPI003A94F21A